MIVYGVDPGVTGAIACMVNGEVMDIADLPVRIIGTGKVKKKIDSAGLAAIVRDWRVRAGIDGELAVIEQVSSMPHQGVASMFSLGHTSGAVEAVFATLGIPIEFVSAVRWKRAMGVKADKATSAARASLLYPASAGYWRLAKGHNRAEAVLIARYARDFLS